MDNTFSYPLRRHDGERPLGIVAAAVAIMTFALDVEAVVRSHDWRPMAFYSTFSCFALAAALVLWLQYTNEKLVAADGNLVHFDWLGRSTEYSWPEVTDAVEKDYVGSERLLLTLRGSRTFVIHRSMGSDPGYGAIREICRQRLRAVGIEIRVEAQGREVRV